MSASGMESDFEINTCRGRTLPRSPFAEQGIRLKKDFMKADY